MALSLNTSMNLFILVSVRLGNHENKSTKGISFCHDNLILKTENTSYG